VGQHFRLTSPDKIHSNTPYLVTGSHKFAVLLGDAAVAPNGGISSYYAMDAEGKGTSTEFYTYVPAEFDCPHSKFIVFGYDSNTAVTVEREISGSYVEFVTFSLDRGMHHEIYDPNLAGKYVHVYADKPVSALTCYDGSGYAVPSADGKWAGQEFYTYISDVGEMVGSPPVHIPWPEDLTIIAHEDGTYVRLQDCEGEQEMIWTGTLNKGQAHVESYPQGAAKYFSIIADRPVSVFGQPWKAGTTGSAILTFFTGPDGTAVGRPGNDLVGPNQNSAFLNLLSYVDDAHISIYDAQTNTFIASRNSI